MGLFYKLEKKIKISEFFYCTNRFLSVFLPSEWKMDK